MANLEATLLNHYKIDSLYPAEWPAEKDAEDSSEDETKEQTVTKSQRISRTKSRYSALERNPRARTSIPGSQKTKEGVENLVQKDEPDPLGGPGSVVQTLRSRGLPVDEDLKLRNRFLLSSTTFSPSLFLSQVHNNASTESLMQGLDFLSRSIEQKSASLKVLVESNFERFVRAKATIDNVYKEMRDQGAETNARPTSSQRRISRPQSRQTSFGSSHFRKTSGPFGSSFSPSLGGPNAIPTETKKNALVKEQDYGVQPIQTPLREVAVKAEEVFGPALGGRDQEQNLRAVLASMEKHRLLFELGMMIQEAIKRRDYESIIEDYKKAKKYADDAKVIADRATQNGTALSDPDMHQIIVTARMWSDVVQQVDSFKRDVWRRLAGTHFTKQPAQDDDQPEEHMELIGVLLELGVEDNPIWVWLLSRYDFLKNKVSSTVERTRVEIEILRRRLNSQEKPSPSVVALYLRAASRNEKFSTVSSIDSPKVIEFWEHVYNSLKAILAIQGGILGEVIEFWETAQGFIGGKAQRTLPGGANARQHHRLSVDGTRELENGALSILNQIRDSIFEFFTEPPVEDISAFFSPIPDTPDNNSPITPKTPKTPKSAALSPFSDTRFRFDPNHLPPPSPRRGDAWERYAFWPPHANSLSGAHYLSMILQLIGTAATEMAALSVVSSSGRSMGDLREFVINVRDRCSQAANASWAADAEYCRGLEDWSRQPQRPEITRMPSRFMAFESNILSRIQKVLFLSDVPSKQDSAKIIPPPSTKLLQGVRSNFVASIYKTLTGMLENVKEPSNLSGIESDDGEGLTIPAHVSTALSASSHSLDVSKQAIRSLLTQSNLHNLRSEVVPQLITQFETNFSVQLTQETKEINETFYEIDKQLFESYVKPISVKLDKVALSGISSPTWAPGPGQRPTDARHYVYTILLEFVNVHTDVTTTAPQLTPVILKHLLEGVTRSLLRAFQRRPRYSLAALMQATLDVEFLAQTLSHYTTDKVSAMQSEIYVALDGLTDNEARLQLQDYLPEMRSILKKLREGTRSEFACFKRPRGTAAMSTSTTASTSGSTAPPNQWSNNSNVI